ncbi:MAG: TraR/DksA family transcriptional regulator [Pseudohongiellaceae bacterium]
MTEFDKGTLDKCKTLLQKLKSELELQLVQGKEATGTVVLDQSKVGRLSRMDAIQQQNMAQSSYRQNENRLRKVNRALAKLDKGDYGYCDECGLPISISRLGVQPDAAYCLDCQHKLETS